MIAALSAQGDSMSSSNLIFALCKSLCSSTLTPNKENLLKFPHSYELLQWEEHQMKKRGQPIKRELEWDTVAREIALLNKPYSRH